MSNLSKTIAYLKRNGIKDTWYAVLERTDRVHVDEMAKFMLSYTGRKPLSQKVLAKQRETQFLKNIRFSILVPAYETSREYLSALIESVMAQTYSNWELIIADASKSEQVKQVVDSFQCSQIVYVKLKKNGGISENTNEGLKKATGEYVALLDHDDLLTPDALFEMALVLEKQEYEFVYSDEDKMSGDGNTFYEPNIKPGFNFDLLLTNNYICHFLIMKRERICQLGFRKERDGAQDFDLLLRCVLGIICESNGTTYESCFLTKEDEKELYINHKVLRNKIGHVPQVLYHWRCHEASTAANPESKRYAYEAGLSAINDFLNAVGIQAHAVHSKHLGFYEIIYEKDLFEAREDVYAFGGNAYSGNLVTASPMLEGKSLFLGMNKHYSGYLHRASLCMDVDELVTTNMVVRPESCMDANTAKEQGMALLYVPDYKS